MTPDPIYLDFNATTPVDPEVLEAMLPYLRGHFGNPSSGHVFGRRAREAVERARAQVAVLINARTDEIVFTSGGTEADNLAVQGTVLAAGRPGRLACSAVEHPAVLLPCREMARRGWNLDLLPVDRNGAVDLAAAGEVIRPGIRLVSVMHSNNETGTLQPVAEIARLAHAAGAAMHSDAAQSGGKIPIDVEALAVDALTLVGHKMYAPKGVGALYIRRGTTIASYAFGGGQERGLRPGTENVALIVGFGAACDLACRRLEGDTARMLGLRETLWDRLATAIPGLRRHGDPIHCLPNTLNVGFPGRRGSAILASAPRVAASTGSACHEGGERPSAVLTAMGLEEEEALGAVRLSLGRTTTEDEIVEAAEALVAAWKASAP